MTDVDDDNALGAYLKDRRTKLDPVAFGFSPERRRTPGLRREEVALRANVSTTWYTWLEQGRGGAPSAEVLDRLSRALALSEVEREHLYLLALGHAPDVRRTAATACAITPQLQRVLDAIESHPALIATSTWDIVGWNSAATIVFGDFAAIPAERRNSLRFMFAPDARARGPNWEHHARALVASFRAETARIGATDRAAALVEELSQSSPRVRRDVARGRCPRARLWHETIRARWRRIHARVLDVRGPRPRGSAHERVHAGHACRCCSTARASRHNKIAELLAN